VRRFSRFAADLVGNAFKVSSGPGLNGFRVHLLNSALAIFHLSELQKNYSLEPILSVTKSGFENIIFKLKVWRKELCIKKQLRSQMQGSIH